MGKKTKRSRDSSDGDALRKWTFFLWPPAILLLALSADEIFLSLRDPWFTDALARIHPWLFLNLGRAFLALAAAMALHSGLRSFVWSRLEFPSDAPARSRRFWFASLYVAIAALLAFLKFCQYRAGLLPWDTAAAANVAYNLMHGGTLESPILGVSSYFAVHFMPIIALFAPLTLLSAGALPMIIAQALVVAAIPIAAHFLVYRRSGSALLGFCAGLLTLTSPLFLIVAHASLALQVCLPAFLLWAAYNVERRRWLAAAVFFILAASCIEQAPFTFFGIGLYLMVKRTPAGGRTTRLWGPAVCAGALILWKLERNLIASYPDHFNQAYYWRLFDHLGSSPRNVLQNALTHPLAMAAKVVWPPTNLLPLWQTLWTTGFLGLAAPCEMIPWAAAFLPHLLAKPGEFYHDLALHYPAYMIGPLLWAMCAGLAKVHGALAARGKAAWSLVYVLFFAWANLSVMPWPLLPGWNPQFYWGLPIMAPKVPLKASLWVVEYASSWFACRRNIKIIDTNAALQSDQGLFMPDYVLIDPSFIFNEGHAAARDSLLTFLSREHYVAQSRTRTLFLFKRPAIGIPDDPSPPPAVLPEPDAGGRALGNAVRKLLDGAQRQRH